MKAGFSEIDISPQPGTEKIGWLQPIKGTHILDPLFARIAVFEEDGHKAAFIQLDTLCVGRTLTRRIREAIKESFGFPSENIMISASHNHAGPAVSSFLPYQERDEAYIDGLITKCTEAFGSAFSSLQEAEGGFASVFNFEVAHNRRTRMRDGTVKTQTTSANKNFLCLEGPRDPELAVFLVRDTKGKTLGALLNYACHPTHHGGDDAFSAGFPGVLAAELKKLGCPVALFLNGAFGNVITVDFETGVSLSMEEAGQSLAKSFTEAQKNISFSSKWPVNTHKNTLQLPFRRSSPAEEKGQVFGAQRFRSDDYYNTTIAHWKKEHAGETSCPAEIQVLGIGNIFFAGVPAEYFVEFQLKIKESFPKIHALTVGAANGMLGYVPSKNAFTRGGYETTFLCSSCMAPETGDLIADEIIRLIKKI
ncbi:MAG: hypothetical protein A2X49_01710 [Lentisphaerae bacterium GWF2_52_8]|nr:MAG: hypothetical protein A2X49_01710 [Lentisphaerae bacterium GWF2_52_8]